ncbi:unnamed protein product [Cylicocyclus nassatus]|uniref:Uncharacterized protein n=1 Tax=Cylicocyclus nassatus TaxID=53992 RepID=A0AA36GYN7_CYLNA|nr:unnamed protein product [Cylicocyclus nassatus]
MGRRPGQKDSKPRKRAEVGNRPCEHSPVFQDQTREQEPGYNTKRVAFLMEIAPTEPLDPHDIPEMERRFLREGLMADGKVNPVTGIFWQKNYDGLRDQQEVVVAPRNRPSRRSSGRRNPETAVS